MALYVLAGGSSLLAGEGCWVVLVVLSLRLGRMQGLGDVMVGFAVCPAMQDQRPWSHSDAP